MKMVLLPLTDISHSKVGLAVVYKDANQFSVKSQPAIHTATGQI